MPTRAREPVLTESLPVLRLTSSTTPEDIRRAKEGRVYKAVRLSSASVLSIREMLRAFRILQRFDMPLVLPSKELRDELSKLLSLYPELVVILEFEATGRR